jgi:hypothetical protein
MSTSINEPILNITIFAIYTGFMYYIYMFARTKRGVDKTDFNGVIAQFAQLCWMVILFIQITIYFASRSNNSVPSERTYNAALWMYIFFIVSSFSVFLNNYVFKYMNGAEGEMQVTPDMIKEEESRNSTYNIKRIFVDNEHGKFVIPKKWNSLFTLEVIVVLSVVVVFITIYCFHLVAPETGAYSQNFWDVTAFVVALVSLGLIGWSSLLVGDKNANSLFVTYCPEFKGPVTELYEKETVMGTQAEVQENEVRGVSSPIFVLIPDYLIMSFMSALAVALMEFNNDYGRMMNAFVLLFVFPFVGICIHQTFGAWYEHFVFGLFQFSTQFFLFPGVFMKASGLTFDAANVTVAEDRHLLFPSDNGNVALMYRQHWVHNNTGSNVEFIRPFQITLATYALGWLIVGVLTSYIGMMVGTTREVFQVENKDEEKPELTRGQSSTSNLTTGSRRSVSFGT